MYIDSIEYTLVFRYKKKKKRKSENKDYLNTRWQ